MCNEVINRPNSIIKISWDDDKKVFIITKISNMDKLLYSIKITMNDLRNDYTVISIPKSDRDVVEDGIHNLIRRLFI